MVGPNTFFVTTQNGIPWWFFQRYSGPPQYNGSIIKAVDPNGRLFHGFDPERIVGMSGSWDPPPPPFPLGNDGETGCSKYTVFFKDHGRVIP
jgi:hypothetical protein